MKAHVKFLTLVIAFFGFIVNIHANGLDGYWTSRDNSFSVEIRQFEDGIQVRQGQDRWSNFYRRGNRYQSDRGSFCRIIDDRSLEWYDRSSRRRLTLFRADRNRDRGAWDRPNQRNDRYNDRGYYNGDLRRLEGRWYNESTGQRIQVKTRRQGMRVKFRGEDWITFRPGRRGVFQDHYGNKLILYRGTMEFESSNRDLIMRFQRGEYRGRRGQQYFRFY